MPLIRLKQIRLLARPTARLVSFMPIPIAGILAAAYVVAEARNVGTAYRLLVLRIAALLICLGAAFVLDDPTEDTLSHVATPLLLRRLLRVALVLPVVGIAWIVCVTLVGDQPERLGGPVPFGDITLEAATLFVITMTAASFGALVASDRLGGVVAAPVLFVLAAIVLFLPPDYVLLASDPGSPDWSEAHDRWRYVFGGAVVAFLYFNLDRGRTPILRRLLRRGPSYGEIRPSSIETVAPSSNDSKVA